MSSAPARARTVVARVHAYPPEHNAGAEWMLHEMLRALAARGHRVQVWLSRWSQAVREIYDLDGVTVIPQSAPGAGEFAAAATRADALVSHLENVPVTASLARGHGIPLIVVCHNTFDLTWAPLATGTTALAVYNSAWMEGEAQVYLHGRARRPQRTLVVRPPVWPAEYRTTRGDAITLVNCSRDKGGRVLAALAARNPHRAFLAVEGGYGRQEPPDLPNVGVLPHMDGRQIRDAVYARTRLLLMPSVYESWGRVGVEAMCSGIPVIAHPTPGLAESLGAAGIFADRDDLEAWQAAIERLDQPSAYAAASAAAAARAAALDPAADLAAWCTAVEEVTARASDAGR